MLYAETGPDHLFVIEEQMMPMVPVIAVDTVDQGIELAKVAEHGYKHSSMIHSLNVINMTKMVRALESTLFVKNGPCVAGLGRVEGSAVSTIRHPSLKGWRLLVCQPVNERGEETGDPVLCLDCLGAGKYQQVIVTSDGKSVREKMGDPHSPARYMTIAVLDDVEAATAEEIPA